MYIESSSPRKQNDTASFMSPLMRSTTTCTMRFFYHMYGAHIGTLNVLRMVGNVKSLVWSISGDNGQKWVKKSIDFTPSSTGFYVRTCLVLFVKALFPACKFSSSLFCKSRLERCFVGWSLACHYSTLGLTFQRECFLDNRCIKCCVKRL